VDWDIQGWGANSHLDPNYAEIVGLFFEHNALKLTEVKVSHREFQNGQFVDVETVLDINNIHHRLDTFISWSGSLTFTLKIEKGDVADHIAFISDNLIMEYTMNGEPQKYTVNLRNVHEFNNRAVIQHYSAQ
jgi:uncharacterized membrane-anchored protein YhcB (DUF1043 family)